MRKKVIVEMLVDVDSPNDSSILEDLKQELNCASHSIDIVSYKEELLDDRSESALPTSKYRIVDIGPLLKDLRKYLDEESGHPTAWCSDEALEDVIDTLETLPVIDPASLRPSARWISVEERLPEEYQTVLVPYNEDIIPAHRSMGCSRYDKREFAADYEHEYVYADFWFPLPELPEKVHHG